MSLALDEDDAVKCMPELLTSLPGPLKRAVLAPLTPKELLSACLVSLAWKETIYGDAALRKMLQDEEDKRIQDDAAAACSSFMGLVGGGSSAGMDEVDLNFGRRLLADLKKQTK